MTNLILIPTIYDFRKIIINDFASKGVLMPAPDSPHEIELYEQWLVGWQKLNQPNDK